MSRIEEIESVWERIDDGDMSPDEVRVAYLRVYEGRVTLAAEVAKAYTIKDLKRMVHSWSAQKKAEWVAAYVDAELDRFAFLVDPVLSVGVGSIASMSREDYITIHDGRRHEERVRVLARLDEEHLRAHAAKVAERRADFERATTAPQTLPDFIRYLTVHEMAVMDLDDEMLARFDRLSWEAAQERIAAARRNAAKIKEIDLGDKGLSVEESFHTKRGVPVWLVKIDGGRVDRGTFKNLQAGARKLGGGWSRYSSAFMFYNEADANTFAGVTDGGADATERMQRREAELRERAADRLAQYAIRTDGRATDALTADRLANTVRRANAASRAEASARDDIALAAMIQSVATAIADGTARALAGLRYVTQIVELRDALRGAWIDATRYEADGRYVPIENRRDVVVGDIRCAKVPYPHIFKLDAQSLLRETKGKRGVSGDRKTLQTMLERDAGEMDIIRPRVAREANALVSLLEKAGWRHDPRWKPAVDRYKRFVAIGVTTHAILRHTLRELFPHYVAPTEADPITMAERELIGMKIPGFFPTPVEPVGMHMAELVNPRSGEVGCEPGAGTGHLIEAILSKYPDAHIGYFEIMYNLRRILRMKFGENEQVFESGLSFLVDQDRRWDWFIMNPPFEKQADEIFVKRAYSLLNEGGRIVSIVSMGTARSDKFLGWLESVGGYVESLLPAGTFRDAGTNVPAAIVVID